jgi:uncharacterized protein
MTEAPSGRTTPARHGERVTSDRAELDRLLDSTILVHVAMTDDNGGVVVIPTAAARDGDRVLVHGSTGSGWMRRAADGRSACLTVTELDGIVVARSGFESSFRYRSAVLFGAFTRLPAAELPAALDVLVDRFIPGRVAELRRPNRRELAATMVLSMPIIEWSVKVSHGWPDDDPDDVAGDAWAGVLEFEPRRLGAAQPAPDLRPNIPLPASVRALADRG